MDHTTVKDVITLLTVFSGEAMKDNEAYSRLGQDDNSYDALALSDIAAEMVSRLQGNAPKDYATYAGPSPEGMDDFLEVPLTGEVALSWLKLATEALESIG